MFHYTDDYFPSSDQYLNFACKNISEHDFIEMTLLWKIRCLQTWTQHFSCSQIFKNQTQIQIWLWVMIQKADICIIILTVQNAWKQKSKLILSKAYNIIKNLFSTSLKDFFSFNHSQMNVLAHIKEYLQHWSEFNLQRSNYIHQQQLL